MQNNLLKSLYFQSPDISNLMILKNKKHAVEEPFTIKLICFVKIKWIKFIFVYIQMHFIGCSK